MARKKVFDVDISEVNRALDALEAIPIKALEQIADEASDAARALLIEIFEEAMSQEDESAFPEPFREHVRSVLANTEIGSKVTPTEVFITFDFNQLGTREDLERAFHQGAQLADGSVLQGPYTGQALKNTDAAERHVYWEAVRRRQDKAYVSKLGHSIRVKQDAWDKTMQNYIEIWGDKAPQWLYLNFGQDKWDPKIGKHDIIEKFNRYFGLEFNNIWDTTITKYIEAAEFGRTPTGKVYYNKRLNGRFIARGG